MQCIKLAIIIDIADQKIKFWIKLMNKIVLDNRSLSLVPVQSAKTREVYLKNTA